MRSLHGVGQEVGDVLLVAAEVLLEEGVERENEELVAPDEAGEEVEDDELGVEGEGIRAGVLGPLEGLLGEALRRGKRKKLGEGRRKEEKGGEGKRRQRERKREKREERQEREEINS